MGYGTIGMSNKEGKITNESDKGDLVIFYSLDNKKEIIIYFFAGGLMNLTEIEEYISELLLSQRGLTSQTAPLK